MQSLSESLAIELADLAAELAEPGLTGLRRTVVTGSQVNVLTLDDNYQPAWHTLKTPAALTTARRARIEYETDRADRHALSVTEYLDNIERIAAARAEKNERRAKRDSRDRELKRRYGIHCPRGFILNARQCGHRQAAGIACHDPFCPGCNRARAARARARWAPIIDKYSARRMLTLTVPSGPDLKERLSALRTAFKKWLGLGLGDRGLDHWVSEMHEQAVMIVASGKSKRTLDDYDASAKRFADKVETIRAKWTKLHPGARFQLRHLLKGLAALEITHGKPGWHPHRHLLLVGGTYIPNTFVSATWAHATNETGAITDIRNIGDRGIFEVLKYVTKPGSVPIDKADEFRQAIRGVKRLWVLGRLRPAEIERPPCPACGSTVCTCTALAECRDGRDDGQVPGTYIATLSGQPNTITIKRGDFGLEWSATPFVNFIGTDFKPRDGPHAAAGPPRPELAEVEPE